MKERSLVLLTSLLVFSGNSTFAQAQDSGTQIIWKDGGNRVDVCKQSVQIWDERANVCYTVSLKRGLERLRINYVDRDGYRKHYRWVEIVDDNHDEQADRIITFDFQYKRNWGHTEVIFRKADELLKRFKGEPEIQKILDDGVVYPDPFLPTQQ